MPMRGCFIILGGHRTLGKRRWDDPTQRTVIAAGSEAPWQDIAQDRHLWTNTEAEFVRRVTRMQRELYLPVGRWMMAEAGE